MALVPDHLLGLQLISGEQLARLLHELEPALLRILCGQLVRVVLHHLPCIVTAQSPHDIAFSDMILIEF